jgi:hypothetical protein
VLPAPQQTQLRDTGEEAKVKRALFGFILIGVFIAAVPADAHHSFAATYFEEKNLTIEGTVMGFDFRNPHSFVTLEVPDRQGNANTWVAEWRSPQRLEKEGVSKDTFRPGDHVVISGSPGRTAAENRIHLKAISRPSDGFKWGR